MQVKEFFDPSTYTLTYLVFDEKSKDAVLIDPVSGYDAASGHLSATETDAPLQFIRSHSLKLHFCLESHVHADHVSGSPKIKESHPECQTAISERIKDVQNTFSKLYNLKDFPCDGSQFDTLLRSGQKLKVGTLEIEVMALPGHTPACTGFYINEEILFSGDVLFMPDFGVGRCDFPAGSAGDLWESVQRIYSLPKETKIFVGHDYQPGGRDLAFSTTVDQSANENIHIKRDTLRDDFIKFREERDATLSVPKLLLPSLFLNINAGHLPKPEDNGTSYLKIPLNTFA